MNIWRILIRADNDVPAQLWEEAPDPARVLFQGHDGVFRLKSDLLYGKSSLMMQ